MLDFLAVVKPTLARSRRAAQAWFDAASTYHGGPYAGAASLVTSKPIGLREEMFHARYPHFGWDDLIAPSRIARMSLDCSHLDMVTGQHAEDLASFIDQRIGAARL
jgi:thioesterase domain-containing protein